MRTLKYFWLGWILVTTVGYALGFFADQILYSVTTRALARVAAGNVSVLLYGLVLGAISGTLQAIFLRSRIDRVPRFVFASMLGGAIGIFLGATAGEAASNLIGLRLDVYVAGAIINILFGAYSGAGIGIAQWLVLREKIPNAGVWVPANIVGLVLGFSIPLGILEKFNLPQLELLFGGMAGLLLGLTQWLWARKAFK